MTTECLLYSYNNGIYLCGRCFTQGSLLFWHKVSYVPFSPIKCINCSDQRKWNHFFMVESFMACYFNYFHFYTMLWNIGGPVFIEKSIQTYLDILYSLKPSFLPPRTPKSLIISILLVSKGRHTLKKLFFLVVGPLRGGRGLTPPTTKQKTTFFL